MQLTKQQKQVLWERIDEILFYKYDPIGIWDLPIIGIRDEYSGYVQEVLDLAMNSVDYQPVKKYLMYLAEDSMGCPIPEEKAEHLGRLIYSLVHSENPATNSDES